MFMSILRITISLTPFLIVLFFMWKNLKRTHYKIMNLSTHKTVEIVTDKSKAISHLMIQGYVRLDSHKLCNEIVKNLSKKGYLIHIYFEKINNMNILILKKGENMYYYDTDKYSIRSDV